MKFRELKEGKIAIPENVKERKTLEGLIEKGVVEYHEGGYWLTKKGIKFCKKMWGNV